jgi:hypothetical protein
MKVWIVGIAAVGAVGLYAISRDSDEERLRTIGQFTLVERVHITRHPYTHIAESGGDAFLPVPMKTVQILSQRLVAGGRTLWSGTKPHFADVSPNGDLVLLRAHNADEPWQILSASGSPLTVPVPPDDSLLPNEARGYPFHFARWGSSAGRPDQHILAYSKGWMETDLPAPTAGEERIRMVNYVRTWVIDAQTGSATRQKMCQQRYTPSPDWTGWGDCETFQKSR